MNFRIAKRLIISLLIAAFTLIAIGCDKHNDNIYFVDRSKSVSPGHQAPQQPQWDSLIEMQIACLKCGDKVRIFAVSNQTLNAAPIYDEELPLGDTFDQELQCRQKLKQVRDELKQKFQEAINPQHHTAESDYFAAIDRIKPDGIRRQKIYFVGDLLQSNAELDLEKVQITESNIANLLNPVLAKHGWQKDMLKGVEVYCILNSLDSSNTQPLNDRRLLGNFWKTLFVDGLGARLMHFDASALRLEGDKEAL